MADITEVAARCQRIYYQGNVSDDAGFEEIDFILAVQAGRAKMVNVDYMNYQRVMGERGVSQSWLQTYNNIAVTLDTDSQTYFSLLPAQYIGIPNDMGIFHISPMQAPDKPFAPITIGQMFMFTRNPIDTINYYADTNNVYYDNFDPNITKVRMQLVPLTSDIIPDDFVQDIIDLVLKQMLLPKTVGVLNDKLNEGNPNRVELNAKQ